MSNSTFLADVVFLMEEFGIGTYGTDVFKGLKALIPEGPGPYTLVVPTGGAGDEGTHNLSRSVTAYERPSAQLSFLGEDYEVVLALANNAHEQFNFNDRMVNGTWWRSCSTKQEPFELPLEKGLVRIAFNIASVKRLSPATS